MKPFDWNPEKSEWLKAKRGFSFEDIVAAVENGCLLDVIGHHNPDIHSNQKELVVRCNGFLVTVPFVEGKNHWFLKTAYRNRKLKERYGLNA